MKQSRNVMTSIALMFALSALLTSCVNGIDYGPNGANGKVLYGIDYDNNPPYSYWDNNDNIPNNPYFGEMYRTERGIYEFEYFINPWEYWYGTYQLYQNTGESGGPNNTPGRDGADTFLLLICNDDGFYFEDWEDCDCIKSAQSDGSVLVTVDDELRGKFQVKMKKATVSERAPQHAPKYKREN